MDDQLRTQMQARAIQGPVGQPVSVFLSALAKIPARPDWSDMRNGLSDRLHAPFTALAVETRRNLQLTEEQRDRIAETLRCPIIGGEAVQYREAIAGSPTTLSPTRSQ